MKYRIGIVGMGVSGLKTAHHLIQDSSQHIDSLIFFEKNSQLGGVLKHSFENGFLFEHGAQGVLASKKAFLDSVQDLKIFDQVLFANQKKQTRYLIKNDKCLPLSPHFFLFLKEKMLNFSSLLKIIKVFLFKKLSPPLFNETLYDFVAKNLGKKIADHFLIPFCFGIWGGGAHKILSRFSFSQFHVLKKTKNSLQGLASFKEGMNFLPQSLYKEIEKICLEKKIKLQIHYNTQITSIKKIDECFCLNESDILDVVIYTGQPWRDMNFSLNPACTIQQQALETLRQIPNHSLAVVGLGGVKKTSFPYPTGFGALANAQSQDLLGVIFVHSTYQEHVPQNCFLYRVLLGGDRDPFICSLTDEELIRRTKNYLQKLKLIAGEEEIPFIKVLRYENYIPLATQHQDKVLRAIWQLEALNPGLYFTGNYIGGVSVADCLTQAQITAKKLTEFFSY